MTHRLTWLEGCCGIPEGAATINNSWKAHRLRLLHKRWNNSCQSIQLTAHREGVPPMSTIRINVKFTYFNFSKKTMQKSLLSRGFLSFCYKRFWLIWHNFRRLVNLMATLQAFSHNIFKGWWYIGKMVNKNFKFDFPRMAQCKFTILSVW